MNKAMTSKDGSSKAKLGHTKNGGIKIEYTSTAKIEWSHSQNSNGGVIPHECSYYGRNQSGAAYIAGSLQCRICDCLWFLCSWRCYPWFGSWCYHRRREEFCSQKYICTGWRSARADWTWCWCFRDKRSQCRNAILRIRYAGRGKDRIKKPDQERQKRLSVLGDRAEIRDGAAWNHKFDDMDPFVQEAKKFYMTLKNNKSRNFGSWFCFGESNSVP